MSPRSLLLLFFNQSPEEEFRVQFMIHHFFFFTLVSALLYGSGLFFLSYFHLHEARILGFQCDMVSFPSWRTENFSAALHFAAYL